MLTVGLTGGIGAGKSLVSRILISMGYPVFNADLEAKRITHQHPQVRRALTDAFGEDIYQSGKLDRARLAAIIFSDSEARNYVNGVIHPLVREEFQRWCATISSPIVFNEAAILFETGSWKQFDRLVLVTAPQEVRIQRVMQRDHVSREAVLARMQQQWSDEQKIPLSDFQIINDEQTPVLAQLEALIERLSA